MRVLHTSDWHLGRAFHGEGMQAAHELYFDHLVELAAESRPDAIVVSGDVYDRALPNPLTVALLDDVLYRLVKTGATIVVTSGNHDSAIRLGFASRVMEQAGLHIHTDVGSIERPVAVPSRTDGPLAGYIVTVPYLEPQVVADHFGVDEPTHATVLREAVTRGVAAARGLPDGDSLPVVGMLHAFFAGATTSESERDICVGGLGVAPKSILEPLDYAALGHLHGAQTLTQRARYSGSPVPMSFSESNHVKGSWLVDVTRDAIDAQFIAAPVYRGLSTLRGTLDDLLADPALKAMEDDWCQVTLTDEVRPADAMDRIRARFPHTLRLQFETPTPTDQPTTYAERVRGRSDVDLCTDFLAHVRGGRGPNATERTAIGQAVASALRRNDEPSPDPATLLPIEGLS